MPKKNPYDVLGISRHIITMNDDKTLTPLIERVKDRVLQDPNHPYSAEEIEEAYIKIKNAEARAAYKKEQLEENEVQAAFIMPESSVSFTQYPNKTYEINPSKTLDDILKPMIDFLEEQPKVKKPQLTNKAKDQPENPQPKKPMDLFSALQQAAEASGCKTKFIPKENPNVLIIQGPPEIMNGLIKKLTSMNLIQERAPQSNLADAPPLRDQLEEEPNRPRLK